MKIFVIHRFKDRKQIKAFFKKVNQAMAVKLDLIFLDSANCEDWREKALESILLAEAAIIYDRKACDESENARWEIDEVKLKKLPVVEVSPTDEIGQVCSKINPIYHLEKEFEACFENSDESSLELYRLMIDSSENLIQRRQKTNAFFITAIGSLLAIAGLLIKAGTLHSGTVALLYGFAVTGILLCNSWKNLIDNYGKLNKAKFDVILRLEKNLNSQIYAAEWISLGKGLRPEKYKSFTSTEKNVPFFFMLLIFALTVLGTYWNFEEDIAVWVTYLSNLIF